jgi:hypothetical protein
LNVWNLHVEDLSEDLSEDLAEWFGGIISRRGGAIFNVNKLKTFRVALKD